MVIFAFALATARELGRIEGELITLDDCHTIAPSQTHTSI